MSTTYQHLELEEGEDEDRSDERCEVALWILLAVAIILRWGG
jgi:hypothetical protein